MLWEEAHGHCGQLSCIMLHAQPLHEVLFFLKGVIIWSREQKVATGALLSGRRCERLCEETQERNEKRSYWEKRKPRGRNGRCYPSHDDHTWGLQILDNDTYDSLRLYSTVKGPDNWSKREEVQMCPQREWVKSKLSAHYIRFPLPSQLP